MGLRPLYMLLSKKSYWPSFNVTFFFFFLIELLDEEEFGEAAESRTYNEDASNSAIELGLLVGNLNFEKLNRSIKFLLIILE